MNIPSPATAPDAAPPAPPALAAAAQPPVRMAFFGPPPLLEGEDTGAYGDLLARVSAAIRPADILEEIWLRDFLDLAWETLRWRRLKAALVNGAAAQGLAAVLHPLVAVHAATSDQNGAEPGSALASAYGLAERWATREHEAVAEVDALLAGAGLTIEAALARALASRLDHVERIDRMIVSAEARRNAVLREIEHHRTTLGQELRRLVPEAEDAEFEVVEAAPAAAGVM
jgi:hypothetical protein